MHGWQTNGLCTGRLGFCSPSRLWIPSSHVPNGYCGMKVTNYNHRVSGLCPSSEILNKWIDLFIYLIYDTMDKLQNPSDLKCYIQWSGPFTIHRPLSSNPSQGHKQWIYDRYEDYMVAIMKNTVFWDMKTHFVPFRKHITSLLHSPAY
jgi:hypothetical protein